MGLLDSLLGDTTPPEPEPETESTIEISEAEHEVVFPVAIERSELLAYKRLIEYDRDTPRSSTGTSEVIRDSLDDMLRGATPGNRTWSEEVEATREDAAFIIEAWLEEFTGDTAVIFVPVGTYFHLARLLRVCEERADIDDDPFETTEELLTAATLVSRLKDAENGDAPSVFAHTDDIPVTRAELGSAS
ncbi:hypothetical protein JZX76_18335 [Haloarcula hispanica]|uniref:Uncharacterized protein n=2 Tax=Haloarcula TaxID=2237 RepID=A0A847U4E6_9EURY|nr:MULTISPECIES: hypothetical protein [Haloarcula]MCJ0621384.1 hypothetical protein [Haloarcula hispanica]NLV08195.1 hypothetical protein [Haloarcula rubripromontorii]RYJ07699.1 hypothetical protein ELS20_18245 [Haloarcula hispanica]